MAEGGGRTTGRNRCMTDVSRKKKTFRYRNRGDVGWLEKMSKKYVIKRRKKMTKSISAREQRLRRAAKRQGLIATKGRKTIPYPDGWMIVDGWTNTICAGAWPTAYSLSLEEAEAYIYETE